jgi:hypothetical protein
MEHRWQYEARDSGESRGELEGLIDEEEEWEIARHYHIQVLIEGTDVLPITVPIQTMIVRVNGSKRSGFRLLKENGNAKSSDTWAGRRGNRRGESPGCHRSNERGD